MAEPLDRLLATDKSVWESESEKNEYLQRWRDTAFTAALDKILETNGNVEAVLQIGEAFGRGLFAEFLREKPVNWTMQEWFEHIMETVLEPMGTGFSFEEVTADQVKTVMMKCSLHDQSQEFNVVGLFTYGFLRSLFRSAFPEGELILGNTLADASPMTEFVFKAHASHRDHFERERVKEFFATRKIG